MNYLRIDNSSLDKYIACPRSAQYYLQHKRERAGSSGALSAGTAAHLVWETRYKHFPTDTPLTPDAIAKCLAALDTHYAAGTHPEGDHRTLPRMTDVLNAYFKTYPTEPWEVIGCELPFELHLGEVEIAGQLWDVQWQGRIDLVVRAGQEVFVVDHKTMSQRDSNIISEYANASGPLGYCWAVQEMSKTNAKFPERVTGFLLNATIIRSGETTRTKLERQEFFRHVFHYDQTRIAEWRDDTLELCRRYLEDAATGSFPMHRRSCVGRYGACQYLDVCQLPSSQRDLYLTTDVFRDVTWSPLKDRRV